METKIEKAKRYCEADLETIKERLDEATAKKDWLHEEIDRRGSKRVELRRQEFAIEDRIWELEHQRYMWETLTDCDGCESDCHNCDLAAKFDEALKIWIDYKGFVD